MSVDMSLTVIHEGLTVAGKQLSIGDKLTYLAHLPDWTVSVQFPDGTKDAANERCFEEFQ